MFTKESIEQALVAGKLFPLINVAIAQGLLRPGRLMSPTEVVEVTSRQGTFRPELNRWTLCGDSQDDWLKAVAAGAHLESSTKVVQLLGGQKVLRISIRCGKWLHHFVVPLVGESTQAILMAAKADALAISMAQEQSSRALIAFTDPAALDSVVPGTVDNIQNFVMDISLLCLALLCDDNLKKETPSVEKVSLSLVCSDELGQLVALAEEAPHTQFFH
ncbi:hypothetical protein [Hydrogenophaga crassostreae]|nr:hypothetical protein [Hydrogenophaga crassostreae]